MLFDLRSRRRQTTIKIVYVFLALVMGGGLILVGVGTGTGGGLLNAFTNNGSGSTSADPLIQKQVKTAVKATQTNPTSAAAWKSLLSARYQEARTSGNYNASSQTYTTAGKAVLNKGVAAWEKYLQLTNDKPAASAAAVARVVYSGLGDYSGMSTVYQYLVKLEPKVAGNYTCLAYTAYAAGNTSLGDLAAPEAIKLAPKLNKLALKQSFTKSKQTASTAKAYAANSGC